MSHFKQFLAGQMRAYPLLYPEPLDIMVAILCGNSTMEWQQGNLVPSYAQTRDTSVMNYSDLNLDNRTDNPGDAMSAMYDKRWLQAQSQVQARRLVDQHMDIIVNADPTTTYFRSRFHQSGSIRELVNGKVGKEAAFLCFPDDIQPDWGQAIVQFQDWLLQSMNDTHGIGIAGQTDHWPEAARVLKENIRSARERLHPLLHGGQSYKEHCGNMQRLSERLIGEILAEEERGTDSSRPKRARP